MDQLENFDKIIDRSNTNAYKYELAQKEFGTTDLLPLWVADMEFASPPFILEAIRKRCDHGVLGYTVIPEGWYSSICNWMERRHHWKIEASQIGFVPGIVSGIALAIQCFTDPGDKILIQSPIYPPFMHFPVANKRELIINQLQFDHNQFHIDFTAFEQQIAGCKLFILCSPHNPGGRIWTTDELQKIAAICIKNNVLIVSDEIHADLTLPGFKHTNIGALDKNIADQVITLMAPSKTFNIPGLSSSYYIITNESIRKRFRHFLNQAELGNGNLFAIIAAQAAFENGDNWLSQLTGYLQKNIDYVDAFLKANIPVIVACKPMASFLIWLDCRALGLPQTALNHFFIDEAKLGLNAGTSFGPGGEGFMRLNIGCPLSIIERAMMQLKIAFDKRF